MVFSTNQVRHLYVVKSLNESSNPVGNLVIPATLNTFKYGSGYGVKLQYVNAKGDLVSTDIMTVNPADSLVSATVTEAETLARYRQAHLVQLDANINGGTPVVGQEYILRVFFRQYVGLSEAYTMYKYGEVHIDKEMTASDFYKKMAISIVRSCAKDVNDLVEVSLVKSDGEDLVTAKTKEADLTGTYTGILLVEGKPVWRIGRSSQGTIPFECQFVDIVYNGEEVKWGVTSPQPTKKKVLPEGELIADLEYFCMGERADIYRNMGWPNSIETKYLVDPSKLYDIITIHSSFEGNGLSSDKSERDIHLAIERTNGSKTLLTSVKTALNETHKFTQLT